MFRALVHGTARRLGFEIKRIKKGSAASDAASESEFVRMLEIVRASTMVSRAGLFSLYRQALFCERQNLAGDFVECGVWKGGAVGLMALINLAHGNSPRHIHLFDSFEEICEPDEKVDGARAIDEVTRWSRNGGTKGRLTPLKGVYDHRGGPGTVEENRRLLEHTIGYDPAHIHFHKGWFQDTLPEQHKDVGRIAILRIDADWYASTKICLDYLFGKVVSGGFVIIDDYGAYDGCRKAVDEFVESTGKPLFLNYVNKDIRYVVMP
jgi:hypothetical protein